MGSEIYDKIPYEGLAYPEMALDYIRSIAARVKWTALREHDVDVLELGCGPGTNLIQTAARNPTCRFLGVDFSKTHIEKANEHLRQTGLTNIQFEEADLSKWKPQRPYEYILCHGVFSWVSREIQEKILNLCTDFLSETGIAFLSFNTYPGWYARSYVRDVLKWTDSDLKSPDQSVEIGKDLFAAIVENMEQKQRPYANSLKYEHSLFANKSINYISHEYLEPHNEAFFISDFIERIGKHNLCYLADARINGYTPGEFTPRLVEYIEKTKDPIKREQLLDLLRNRSFRRALIAKTNSKFTISNLPVFN